MAKWPDEALVFKNGKEFFEATGMGEWNGMKTVQLWDCQHPTINGFPSGSFSVHWKNAKPCTPASREFLAAVKEQG